MTEPSRPSAPKPERIIQLCAFVVGGEEYVIDIMRIHEIIKPLHITSVPRTPESVEGVVNLRGAIIPIMDLRKRLGCPVTPLGKKSKIVICTVGGGRVGLLVDQVTEVLRIPRSAVRRAPGLIGSANFFLGVCGPPDRLKLLLNLKALLESPAKVPHADARSLARQASGGQEP